MLMNLQKHATREKVVVRSVNWRQDYREFVQVKSIFKNLGTDITLISDEYGRTGDAYGVKAIPHMIIVDRDGKIAAIHVGYGEEDVPVLVERSTPRGRSHRTRRVATRWTSTLRTTTRSDHPLD